MRFVTMSTESQPTSGKDALADKTLYSELTEKQQAIVDAIIEHPKKPNSKIGDIADATGAYVSTIKEKYPEIIEERERVINNQHDTVERGNVRVEGEIDLSDPDTYPRPQTFDERPVKTTECEHTIDDFLPEDACDRLERIAEDISPDWLDRRATVEETVRALALNHALPEDIGDNA